MSTPMATRFAVATDLEADRSARDPEPVPHRRQMAARRRPQQPDSRLGLPDADVIISVNLNGDLLERRFTEPEPNVAMRAAGVAPPRG
jgi:hypothetical protein